MSEHPHLDLSALDPEKHELLFTNFGHLVESERWADLQGVVDIWSGMYPAGTSTASLSSEVGAARERITRAVQELDEARSDFRERIRFLYRSGATAGSLSDAAGLSLARINQLVIGARK